MTGCRISCLVYIPELPLDLGQFLTAAAGTLLRCCQYGHRNHRNQKCNRNQPKNTFFHKHRSFGGFWLHYIENTQKKKLHSVLIALQFIRINATRLLQRSARNLYSPAGKRKSRPEGLLSFWCARRDLKPSNKTDDKVHIVRGNGNASTIRRPAADAFWNKN